MSADGMQFAYVEYNPLVGLLWKRLLRGSCRMRGQLRFGVVQSFDEDLRGKLQLLC
jgi:hypothetical protein